MDFLDGKLDNKCNSTSTSTTSSKEVVKQGILDILFSLTYGSGEVRLQAACEIRKMTKTSAKTRAYLAAAGVITPLVAMLSSTNQELKEAALLALLNLAVGNERNKQKIVKAGAVAPLIDLLQSHDNELREAAAAAIYTLSAASVNKSIIGSAGATPLLIEMLSTGSVQGKVDAVMALYNLSSHPENIAPIVGSKAVRALLMLLKGCKKSSNVAEKTTSLLELVAGYEEGRRGIGRTEGGILTLIESVEEGSSKSKEHAVGCLLALCESNRCWYKKAMLEEGVIPGLLEVSVLGNVRGREMAQRLLELLRERRHPSSSSPGSVSVSAAHSPTSGKCRGIGDEDARRMLAEMVQMSMEQSMRHLQQRALCTTSSSGSSSSNSGSSAPSSGGGSDESSSSPVSSISSSSSD